MTSGLVLALRVVVFFFAVMVSFMVGGIVSTLAGGSGASSNPRDQATLFNALLLMCGSVSLVVSFIVWRARASGWPLAAVLSLATFGSMTFLYYIEAVVFLRPRMSQGNLNGMLAMGIVFAVLIGPLAIWILGRARRSSVVVTQPIADSPSSTTWRLATLGVVYVVLYFVFGYFVAWQNPALRRYYGGTDPGSFLASVSQNWINNSWIFPLQFARGILWVLFLLPLIRRFGRRRLETGLAMALFCAVWCLQLLFPNPYMPASIRWSHLIETLGSNLIFGFVVGWLMSEGAARLISVRE